MPSSRGEASSAPGATNSGTLFSRYFLVVLLAFGVLTLVINSKFVSTIVTDEVSVIEHALGNSIKRLVQDDMIRPTDDDDDDSNHQEEPASIDLNRYINGEQLKQKPQHNNMSYQKSKHPPLAGLNCEPFGGPSNEIAQEMVYWEDIPSDANWRSPFYSPDKTRYLTFEPDAGGW